MAKIESVDYNDLPRVANTISSTATQLYNELKNAYAEVSNMHNNWYGKRYNALVTEFNNLVPELNEMLKLTMHDIPYTLRLVANNYSQADGAGNIQTATDDANTIAQLSTFNDTGMRFVTENVEASQKKVTGNFTNASNDMDQIYTDFKTAKWTSEAATAFDSKLNSLKNSIKAQLENLNKSFVSLMTQTLSDMASTETANTVE